LAIVAAAAAALVIFGGAIQDERGRQIMVGAACVADIAWACGGQRPTGIRDGMESRSPGNGAYDSMRSMSASFSGGGGLYCISTGRDISESIAACALVSTRSSG